MENAETILVVVLASFLALFLLLGIVLLVKLIQITNQLKRIADKAEDVVDKAESVGEFFQKASGGFAVGKLFSHLANTVLHRDEAKESGKGK